MLPGVDVSKYNGTPSTAGLAFGVARATYAAGPDPKLARHLATFHAGGLASGAYHFGVGADQVSIARQAAVFLAVTRHVDFLALDLEANWLKRPDGTRYLGPTMSHSEAAEFIRRVHAGGRSILLYASRSGFPFDLGQDGNWVAEYGRPGARFGLNPPRGIGWTFWQWQGTPLDRDWFRGSRADLARLVAASHRAP
jgi:GH25 family lysozyme M1 (1,4-beta-N-acetylmuramidase)